MWRLFWCRCNWYQVIRDAGEKGIVILKSGRSTAGEKSVASHTASLAGAHKVFHAACRQYGAIPVDNLQDLYDYGKLLSTMDIPQGNRLLILSSSGGIGVIAVDEAETLGIIEGMLVCHQAEEGVELIVGAMDDPVFGPTFMVGMGGIFAEIMQDTAFRVAPLTPGHAREMLMELKGYPLLAGARGTAPCDVNAVVDLIMNLSCLAMENPDIRELDLNPVRVYQKGLLALDVRIMR